MDSWWSCDCTKKELLRRKIKGLKAFCVAPKNLVGRNFNNLRSDDLKCKKTPSIWAADIKDTEYHPTNLSCAATGEKNMAIRFSNRITCRNLISNRLRQDEKGTNRPL